MEFASIEGFHAYHFAASLLTCMMIGRVESGEWRVESGEQNLALPMESLERGPASQLIEFQAWRARCNLSNLLFQSPLCSCSHASSVSNTIRFLISLIFIS